MNPSLILNRLGPNEGRNPMSTLTPVIDRMFLLQNVEFGYQALGMLRRLPAGGMATLPERVRRFFSENSGTTAGIPEAGADQNSVSPAVLVGAFPFDPQDEDFLYQPKSFELSSDLLNRAVSSDQNSVVSSLHILESVQEPLASDYAHAVETTRAQLAKPNFPVKKVVLARSLKIQADKVVDPLALAAQLSSDSTITTFLTPLPSQHPDDPEWLLGATPELLVSQRGLNIVSHPLAGSIPRNLDPELDQIAAQSLLDSSKDHDEHRFVVEAIREALEPLCVSLDIPEKPELRATATMWHLGTRICGVLKDSSINVAEVVAALHPTPAVCGTPQDQALNAILKTESFERGFYSGAVGWMDSNGDGDWYVAIRCAHVQNQTLRLFAGAGIVAESVPELELQETSAKFRAMLRALNIADSQVN